MLGDISGIWGKYGPLYLKGLWGTLWMSLLTVLIATVLGTVVALVRGARFRPTRFLMQCYIEIVRGTPILLQLYFFWIFMPKLMPFEVSDTVSIVTALIFNAGAYIAEVIRAGIQAVDAGQTEAALSLGFSGFHLYTRIILPQALKNILPALGNEFIVMIKETSLASVFFVPELTTSYKTVQSVTFKSIPSLTIAGFIYLALTFLLTRLLNVLERRLKSNER